MGCFQYKKGYFEKKWHEIGQNFEKVEESISTSSVFTSKMSISNDKMKLNQIFTFSDGQVDSIRPFRGQYFRRFGQTQRFD